MHGEPTNLLTPRTFLAVLRMLWVALAITMGLALRDAGAVASTLWWAVVAAAIIALVVPSPVGLTALRMVTPATLPATVLALTLDGPASWTVVALTVAVLASAVALSGEIGEALVQGSAYGHEQRFPLRVPAALLAPMTISWLVWCAGTLAAVVYLGDHNLVIGAPLAVVSCGLTWLLGSRFHRLTRRWLVLVPAGIVVHDHLVLGETLMVPRLNLSAARLALADTRAADLTGPAAGHAMEISVREMVLVALPSTRDDPKGRAIHVQSFLVSPTRPGRALQAMADGKLRIG